jgi:hypothetical protein
MATTTAENKKARPENTDNTRRWYRQALIVSTIQGLRPNSVAGELRLKPSASKCERAFRWSSVVVRAQLLFVFHHETIRFTANGLLFVF